MKNSTLFMLSGVEVTAGLPSILQAPRTPPSTTKPPYCFKQDPPLDPLQLQANIDAGLIPLRNPQGSSGSYRLRNLQGDPVAIFKPAAEEPYAQANPRWSKWLQRCLCPCLFGRACLPLGHGWLSERAAWLTDQWLGLGLVPRTELTRLHSTAFSLTGPQMGSLQEWVTGFRPAPQVLCDIAQMPIEHGGLQGHFLKEFQRLVILDTLIGNTDRNPDNWLIHLSWRQTSSRAIDSSSSALNRNSNSAVIRTSKDSISLSPMASIIVNPVKSNTSMRVVQDPRLRMEPIIKIAAIDNGLAFPHQSPNRWWPGYRSSWLWLPQAHEPFLADPKLMARLQDGEAWESLSQQLELLFEPTGQGHSIVNLMGERRTQLLQAMAEHLTPWELVHGQRAQSSCCLLPL